MPFVSAPRSSLDSDEELLMHMTSLQKQLKVACDEIEALEAKNSLNELLKETISDMEEDKSRWEREMRQLDDKIKGSERTIARLKEEKGYLKERVATLEEKVRAEAEKLRGTEEDMKHWKNVAEKASHPDDEQTKAQWALKEQLINMELKEVQQDRDRWLKKAKDLETKQINSGRGSEEALLAANARYESLEKSIFAEQKKAGRWHEQVQSLQKQLAETDTELESSRSELAKAQENESELGFLRITNMGLEKQVAFCEAEKTRLQDSVKELEAKLTTSPTAKDEMRSLRTAKAQNDVLRKTVASLQKKLSDIETERDRLKQASRPCDKSDEVTTLRAANDALKKTAGNMQKEIIQLKKDIKSRDTANNPPSNSEDVESLMIENAQMKEQFTAMERERNLWREKAESCSSNDASSASSGNSNASDLQRKITTLKEEAEHWRGMAKVLAEEKLVKEKQRAAETSQADKTSNKLKDELKYFKEREQALDRRIEEMKAEGHHWKKTAAVQSKKIAALEAEKKKGAETVATRATKVSDAKDRPGKKVDGK